MSSSIVRFSMQDFQYFQPLPVEGRFLTRVISCGFVDRLILPDINRLPQGACGRFEVVRAFRELSWIV
jgi:hypothetical protein